MIRNILRFTAGRPAAYRALTGLLGALAISALLVSPADARRGGSFGSRGSRTYFAPPPTRYSPGYVAPMQRSMTARPAYAPAPGYVQQPYQQPFQSVPQRRFGFGSGLLAGGLVGAMMGHGMGGYGGGMGGGIGGGFLMGLIQLALIGGAIWFVVGLLRRNSANSNPAGGVTPPAYFDGGLAGAPPQPFMPAAPQYGAPASQYGAPAMASIPVTEADKAAFEALLGQVQDAFGHEDYGRLRDCTTPEIMSYLAEELSQNATKGLRNDVTATRLIDAKVSEAWHEDNADFATVALHYESIDVMLDRATNAIVSGDAARPSETTELWTFIRTGGAPWKLSAIQET